MPCRKEPDCTAKLVNIGIDRSDAYALRRIAMRLHRWHELECGVEGGGVERDEATNKVTWYSSRTGQRAPYRDYETPALARLGKIMARYPDYRHYVQGDPRGAALYILSPERIAWLNSRNREIHDSYTQGVAVY